MGPVTDFVRLEDDSFLCGAGLAPFSALWEINEGVNPK